MEVDVTEKFKYLVKYGLVSVLALAALVAGGLWYYQNQQTTLRIYDARVNSTMVGVKALAGGKLGELAVSDGEHVEAGQLIARVEVSVTEEQIRQLEQTVELAKQNLAQVRQGQTVTVPIPGGSFSASAAAQADVARAQERMNRMQELFEMGAVSANARDAAAADYQAAVAAASSYSAPSVSYQTMTQPSAPEVIQSAELSVRQAEAALENAKKDAMATEIMAPVAGTVYLADVQEGSEIRPGQVIVNIGDGDNIWLEARVTEEQLAKLHLGQFVSYDLEGHELQGTLIEIDEKSEDRGETAAGATEGSAPQQEEDDGKTRVKISLPTNASFDYKPGMKATVRVKQDV